MKFGYRITFIMMIIFVIMANYNIVNAAPNGDGLFQNMESDIDNFLQQGKENAPEIGDALDQFGSLAQILVSVGAAAMVAVTTYMGIKYLVSGPEAQAKLKVQLIGLVVSGVVIFGSYNG